MRRAGAHALSSMGWSLPLVRSWGRWSELSEAVKRYVQHTPLVDVGKKVASVIYATLDGVPVSRLC